MIPALALAAFLLIAPAGAQEPSKGDGPWSFAVIGHTRGGPGNGNIPRAKLEEAVAEIARLAPDFAVLAGDLVWGDYETEEAIDVEAVRRDLDEVDRIWSSLPMPVHRVPGNHDVWDPLTRDLWLQRYGDLYRSIEHRGTRILLLCSAWRPAGDQGRVPGDLIRGAQLDPPQVEFVRWEMEAARAVAHVFVVMHHVLWWEDDAAWWRDVHPLLAAGPTRAVIAGDSGPWKFSHVKRDAIDYVQSAVDFTDPPPLRMLRNMEGSRALTSQLDTFLVVRVDGPKVDYEVRTLRALSSEMLQPSVWRDVHAHDRGTPRRRLFEHMNTPARAWRAAILIAAGAFAAGALTAALGFLLKRARRGPS